MSETSAPGPVSAVPDRFSSTSAPVVGPGLSTPIDPAVDDGIPSSVEFFASRYLALVAAYDRAVADLAEARAERDVWITRHNQEVAWAKTEKDKIIESLRVITAERDAARGEIRKLNLALAGWEQDVQDLRAENERLRPAAEAYLDAVQAYTIDRKQGPLSTTLGWSIRHGAIGDALREAGER